VFSCVVFIYPSANIFVFPFSLPLLAPKKYVPSERGVPAIYIYIFIFSSHVELSIFFLSFQQNTYRRISTSQNRIC
jgi:hypothetical protein